MPKECGSWRAFRTQACHPPRGPAHPLHYQLTQSLPPGRLLSPRPHSCCVELARWAHTDTGLNRPCVQSASGDITVIKSRQMRRMCSILIQPLCKERFCSGSWEAHWSFLRCLRMCNEKKKVYVHLRHFRSRLFFFLKKNKISLFWKCVLLFLSILKHRTVSVFILCFNLEFVPVSLWFLFLSVQHEVLKLTSAQ